MTTTNPYESSLLQEEARLLSGGAATATRWRVVGMAIAMAMLLYLDRFALNAMQPVIMQSLDISKSQMGWVSSAFFWAYALAQVPAGLLGDRFGGRATLTSYVALWSFAFLAQAFATSFEMLIVFRVLQGIAQAGAYAVTASFLKVWIEPERRGFANSSVSMGGRTGGALNNFITPVLVASLGLLLFRLNVTADDKGMPWRPIFAAYAALGFLWAIVFYGWFRNTPEEHRGVNEAELAIIRGAGKPLAPLVAQPPPPPFYVIVGNRNLWLISTIMFLVNVGWIFLATFQANFLFEVYKSSLVKAGGFTALTAFGGIAGCLCGGLATDYLVVRLGLVWGRRLPGLIACAGAATMYLMSLLLDSALTVAMAFACVYFLNDFMLGAVWSAVQDVGGRNSGAMFGFMNMSGNLGAAAFLPVIGALAEAGQWNVVFLASAGALFTASVLWFFVDPRIKLPDVVV
jgi:MFS family permease